MPGVAKNLPDTLRPQIEAGCNDLNLSPSSATIDKLAAFVTLLDKWNRVYNLTAVRKPTDMVSRHLLDSLAVLPWITGPSLLDIGSGAGLPGLPLAILRPELNVVCVDAGAKKARFLRQAVAELDLHNVQVENQRVENFSSADGFQQLISRAFASLAAMHTQAGHLCAASGQMLAMKGASPTAELAELQKLGLSPDVVSLQVPDLDAERHLVRWLPTGAPVQA